MQTLLQDLRYGARMLFKKPGFTLIAVLTLALGIGANTAIFSVVNAVLLRPLPFPDPDRLLLVRQNLPKIGWQGVAVSAAELFDYQEGNQVFSEMAGYTVRPFNLTGHGDSERMQVARVSASLFPLLGIAPLRGRAFTPEEDQQGKGNVVILSEGIWRTRFGADADIVGRTINLDENPFTVVGVMPSRFRFPATDSTFAEAVELWVPLAMSDGEKEGRANSFDYGLIGRLKAGASIEQAQANMEAVASRMQEQHKDIYQGNVQVTASVVGLEETMVKKTRPALLILLAAVGLVLLIACANVANLLLARAASRRKEIAIRNAMGASRWRLMRQLLTESALIAAIGGATGLLLAVWAVDLILKFGPDDIPRLAEVSLDWQALGFTLIVSLATGMLFGMVPALQSSRIDLNTALKEAGDRTGRGREGKRLRSLLVIFETACALVLLAGAGLLASSFIRLMSVPPGFNPEGVVVARTSMPRERFQEGERYKAVYRNALDRLASLPGVEAVAVATNLPLADNWSIGFRVEGDETNTFHTASNTWASNDYFRAMGIRLLKGRNFTDEDREGMEPVIVVNESMARRYWPGEDAVGKRIRWGAWGLDWLTIVGVVADVKISSLESENKPATYMPIFQVPRTRRDVVFIARSKGDPGSLTAAMRDEIKAVDAGLPVYDIRAMNQIIAESVEQRKFSMLLLLVFSAVAMLLAAVGLYGVMSYSVAERTREIGIRMALGAKPAAIVKLVVMQGLTLSLVGVVLGLVGAFGLTRLMESLLYGVKATDPMTFAGVSALLLAVAILACYLPARRAAKVDPMEALRYE